MRRLRSGILRSESRGQAHFGAPHAVQQLVSESALVPFQRESRAAADHQQSRWAQDAVHHGRAAAAGNGRGRLHPNEQGGKHLESDQQLAFSDRDAESVAASSFRIQLEQHQIRDDSDHELGDNSTLPEQNPKSKNCSNRASSQNWLEKRAHVENRARRDFASSNSRPFKLSTSPETAKRRVHERRAFGRSEQKPSYNPAECRRGILFE